jgi:hypothetical protein
MFGIRTGKFNRYHAAAQVLQPKSVIDSEITAGHLAETTYGATDLIEGYGGQAETAILAAAGALTTGNISVTVTASGLTGSPLLTTVAVLNTDTVTTAAEKIRVALRAVAVIAAMFEVGGTGPRIMLKKKVTEASDATLNIALANGAPSASITAAATSVNTQQTLAAWAAGARGTANAGTLYSGIAAFSAVAANRP